MNKKFVIGLLIVAGIYVGYKYYSKRKNVTPKKEIKEYETATESDAYDFYNKLSLETGLSYSDEGVKNFVKTYSELISKDNHKKIMSILDKEIINRTIQENNLIEYTTEQIINMLKP
jgi:hypothetical protein